MSRYAEPMARLIEELKKLPGVGTKSAQRYAFHLLRSSDEDAAALAEAVRGLTPTTETQSHRGTQDLGKTWFYRLKGFLCTSVSLW